MNRKRLLVGMATKNTSKKQQTKEKQQEKEHGKPDDETSPILNSLSIQVSTNNEWFQSKEHQENSLTSLSDNNPVLREINENSIKQRTSHFTSSTYISPLHSDQSDIDDSDFDPNLVPGSTGKVPSLLRGRIKKMSSDSSSSRSSSESISSSSYSRHSSSIRSENETNNSFTSTGITEVQTAVEPNVFSEVQGKIKVKKRVRNENKWKNKIVKTLRDTGKSYISATKKQVPCKKMGPTWRQMLAKMSFKD